MNMEKQVPLPVCILMDIFGYISYTIPLFGEWTDLIWAPISAIIFYNLFGGKAGKLGAGISFWEEILPFTDFFPSFSIAWLVRKVLQKPVTVRV
jgi:hypothetical protein